jgi:ribosome-associated protein
MRENTARLFREPSLSESSSRTAALDNFAIKKRRKGDNSNHEQPEEQPALGEMSGESKSVAYQLFQACIDASAKDALVIKMSGLSDFADYFIIASGRSDRQVQGIAQKAIQAAEECGEEILHVEGLDNGQWVVVDLGSVVVHLFYEPLRSHYDLESLWSQAPRIGFSLQKNGKVKERVL